MPFAGQQGQQQPLQPWSPAIADRVYADQRAMNASRHIPDTPEMFREISESRRVFIFNVGPWSHSRELGSAGTFRIPACAEGKEYSTPVVIEGVEQEPYPINEVECKMLMTEGIALANQVLGEGPFVPKSSSFRPFGVFISSSNPPKKEDVAAARQALGEKYVELVAAAADAYQMGPQAAKETIRPEWHFVAARALRKSEAECPWLANTQAPAARNECPGCGTVYKVGIIKCGNCQMILDKKKFDQAVKDGLMAPIA